MKKKNCTKCGVEYSATLEHFPPRKIRKDGLDSQCRKCKREYDKKYRQTEKGREVQKRSSRKYGRSEKYKLSFRKKGLKKRYDLTLEDYDRMFEGQNGVCAVCNSINFDGHRLYVDHNHKTGKVRGLVCRDCNFFLGHLEKNYSLLFRALKYLKC